MTQWAVGDEAKLDNMRVRLMKLGDLSGLWHVQDVNDPDGMWLCVTPEELTPLHGDDILAKGEWDFFDFIADPKNEGFVKMFAQLLQGFDGEGWRKRRTR